MKTLIKFSALALAAALASGCAGSGWKEYSAANGCAYSGDRSMRKEVVMRNVDGAVMGPTGTTPSVATMPMVQMRPVYKYNCKNGDIWAYQSPNG